MNPAKLLNHRVHVVIWIMTLGICSYFCSNVSSDGDSSTESSVKCDKTGDKAAKYNVDENSENETSENDEGMPRIYGHKRSRQFFKTLVILG